MDNQMKDFFEKYISMEEKQRAKILIERVAAISNKMFEDENQKSFLAWESDFRFYECGVTGLYEKTAYSLGRIQDDFDEFVKIRVPVKLSTDLSLGFLVTLDLVLDRLFSGKNFRWNLKEAVKGHWFVDYDYKYDNFWNKREKIESALLYHEIEELPKYSNRYCMDFVHIYRLISLYGFDFDPLRQLVEIRTSYFPKVTQLFLSAESMTDVYKPIKANKPWWQFWN